MPSGWRQAADLPGPFFYQRRAETRLRFEIPMRRNVLWANLLHLKALGHVGVHEADMQSQHLRPFLAQLDA